MANQNWTLCQAIVLGINLASIHLEITALVIWWDIDSLYLSVIRKTSLILNC